MKFVCVLFPDYRFPNQYSNTPDGILRIYTLLKQIDVDVEFLDCRVAGNDEQLKSILKEVSADVFLFSATTSQGNMVNVASKVVKEQNKYCTTVLGGTHVNAIISSAKWHFRELPLIHPDIDVFASGYYWGERCVEGLCYALQKRTVDEKILHFNTELPHNIALPLDYDVLGKHKTSMSGGVIRKGNVGLIRTQNILFTVGCRYNCGFCFNEIKTPKRENPEQIIAEIRRRMQKYYITGLKVNDDDPFYDLEWNEEFISQLSSSNIRLRYLISTRCDVERQNHKKLEQLIQLNRLGTDVIGVGVEWASDEVLKKVHKGVTLKKIKETIELLSKHTNAEILCYSVFGLPGLKKTTVDEMVDFIYWAKNKVKHISMTNFVPLIGSPIYETPKKYNMNLYVPQGYQEGINWEDFYFSGEFDKIHALPTGVGRDKYLSYKVKIYKALKACGFLRKETEADAVKAGYKI